jgi:hypothetical protein
MSPRLLAFAFVFILPVAASAAVAPPATYSQPLDPAGGLVQSSCWVPGASANDQYVVDNFALAEARGITEVRWVGGFDPAKRGSGGPVVGFTVSIFESTVNGRKPAVSRPPLATFHTLGDAAQTPAERIAGVQYYAYRLALPEPFQAAAATTYWVLIVADQMGLPDWCIAAGTGGDGRYFRASGLSRDARERYVYEGDACFTLLSAVNATATPGVYDALAGTWFLRNSNTPGVADATFPFGASGAELVPIAGRWIGTPGLVTGPGLYDPASGSFFLKRGAGPGAAESMFAFGPAGEGLLPVTGDWNGDAYDTVGVYNPTTGVFFLKNTDSGGAADLTFSFGPPGLVPLAGDWDGDGVDTIGVYDPQTARFFLKNTNAPGPADLVVTFGVPELVPVVGDWDGNGTVTVGVYDPATGAWFLKNTNTPGAADLTITFGRPNMVPIPGDWDRR